MSDSDDDSIPELMQPSAPAAAAVVEEVIDTSLANSDVTTKYTEAAKVANVVMNELVLLCVEGANVIDICKAGDNLIDQKLSLVYRAKGKDGKAIDKGIAFPVCVSVNEIVCHCSPLDSDASFEPLKGNDIVKLDLGVHIDGYIAVVAHSVVVGVPLTSPITGKRANVFNAAYTAAECALRMIRPGNTNHQITDAIQKVAEAYGVNAISGTLMHQMKRYVIDGNKMILLRPQEVGPGEEPPKIDTCTFEVNEVYAVDVAMSSGDGKPREKGTRTTVYKRVIDRKYALKSKISRGFLSELNKRFPTFPFSLRNLSDEKTARMGLRECVNHELILPYPVLSERDGDDVAHFKFTVLVLASGTSKVTGLSLPEGFFVTDSESVVLPEEITAVLALEEGSKKKKKNNKKKSAGAKKADAVEETTEA